jgi:hypothetical protein
MRLGRVAIPNARLQLVSCAAMRDARYGHELGQIVNQIQDAPISYSYTPLIFISFELLAF